MVSGEPGRGQQRRARAASCRAGLHSLEAVGPQPRQRPGEQPVPEATPAQVHSNPDTDQLRSPSGPVKAKGSHRDRRRRRRQRQVAKNQHPVVPDQVSHLSGADRDLTQQRRDVPLTGQGSAPHQQRRRGRVAARGGVHPARVTWAAWPRLGCGLARTGRPSTILVAAEKGAQKGRSSAMAYDSLHARRLRGPGCNRCALSARRFPRSGARCNCCTPLGRLSTASPPVATRCGDCTRQTDHRHTAAPQRRACCPALGTDAQVRRRRRRPGRRGPCSGSSPSAAAGGGT